MKVDLPLKFRFTIRDLIILYLQFYLLVDLINGFVLNTLNIGEALSPGQIIRVSIYLLISIYLFTINRKFVHFLIPYYLMVALYQVIFIWINHLRISAIVLEINIILKLSLYLSIFLFCVLELDQKSIRRIVFTNFVIFTSAIVLTYIFGIGNDGYRQFEASKGFFYANNSTSIVGLCFLLYYYFIDRKVRRIMFLTIILFITGSKMFVVALGLLAFHFGKIFIADIKRVRGTIVFYVMALILFLSIGIPYAQSLLWENRYKARILGAYYNSAKAGLMDSDINIFIQLYSYLSYVRAYHSKLAIEYLVDHPINWIFGLGTFFTRYNIFGYFRSIETDFTEMLVMYGLLGLLFYLGFHIVIILRINKKARYIAVLVLIYSMLAGHYVYNPMSYTLPACIMGYYFHYNKA